MKGWWDEIIWDEIIYTTVRNRAAYFKPGTDFKAVAKDVTDKFLQWRASIRSKDISDNKLISKIVSLMDQVEDNRK